MIPPCIRRWRMTRKDSEKDTDRPHYYSQYWLDVAAGRVAISSPKVEEEAELAEADLETLEPNPTPLRKAGRSTAPASDGYKSTQTLIWRKRKRSRLSPSLISSWKTRKLKRKLKRRVKRNFSTMKKKKRKRMKIAGVHVAAKSPNQAGR